MSIRRSRFFRSVLASAAGLLLALAAPARADLIATGSTYDFSIWGSPGSGVTTHGPVTFDGLWESFTRKTPDGNQIGLRINESQVDLGGGMRALEIFIYADADIFPVAGEGGFFNLGYGGDLLDVLGNVKVESAVLSLLIGDSVLVSADFYGAYPGYFAEPWSGGFLNGAVFGGWGNAGGRGVDGITLRIVTSDIPVPAPAPLALLALGAVALLRRRR